MPNAVHTAFRRPTAAPLAHPHLGARLACCGLVALLAACQQLPLAHLAHPDAATATQAPATPHSAQAGGGASLAVPPRAPAAEAPAWRWDAVTPSETEPAAWARPAATPSPPADLWARLRQGMRLAEPGGKAGQAVAQHEQWYRQNAAHMHRTFTRARLYLHDIVEAVEREGMPLEIALLPAVESAFIPEARSHAAAEGLWQFIAPTGRRFDLKQHLFQDDRRAVRAATRAALRYLHELQQRYKGDYQLALAAYNCGEGCIDRAVQQARARGLPGRFEDLQLNRETADYVPKLMGLVRVVAQAVDSGDLAAARLPPMANQPYFSAVPIGRDIDVALAAELAGLSLAEFRALNPQHKKPVIVAAANAEVLVPVAQAERFAQALRHHRGPLATWGAAKVARRSSVEALAQQHGTPAPLLRQINQIPPGHLVSPGSTLVVQRHHSWGDIPEPVAVAATLATVPAMVRHSVPVLRKDSWASLAQRLDVSVADLRSWNPQLKTLRKGATTLQLPLAVAERVQARPHKARAAAALPATPRIRKHRT